MGTTEKCTFTSPTFSTQLKTMFEGLHEKETYSDVTLVCDDKVQYKVHKIVLSTWSQVFKEIIDNNPSTNPLIYLRGIQHEEMDSILQFMYLGKGTFYQERMGMVFKVAQDLEIKEIVFSINSNVKETIAKDENNDIEYYEVNEEEKSEDRKVKPIEENIKSGMIVGNSNISVLGLNKEQEVDGQILEDEKQQTFFEEVSVEEDKNTQELEINQIKDSECSTKTRKNGLKSKLRKNSTDSNYRCPECGVTFDRKRGLLRHCLAEHGGLRYPCSLCEFKTRKKATLRIHMESQHQGVTYLCSLCGVQCKTQTILDQHNRTQHGDGGPKFTCSQCGFQFARLLNLTTHVQSKHEGIKFPCTLCEGEFTYERGLKSHIQSVHKGMKYPCSECQYQATTRGNLDIHFKTIHQGVRFHCDQCDYKASRDYYVKRHVKMNHSASK